MTQEERKLLLKDLCTRLHYGVKVLYNAQIFEVQYIEPMHEELKLLDNERYTLSIEEVKPYLLPLKSITDEQKYELHFFGFYLLENDETGKFEINNYIDEYAMPYGYRNHQNCYKLIDWLHKHHIDYRGLIDKELAIDATGLNIY